jgi:GT2 family glycosyltransferase
VEGGRTARWLRVAGWVAARGSRLRLVRVSLAGRPLGIVACRLPRPDVRTALGDWCPLHVGFDQMLPIDPDLTGRQDVTLTAQDDEGEQRSWTRSVEIEGDPPPRTRPGTPGRASFGAGWLEVSGTVTRAAEGLVDVIVDGALVGRAWAALRRGDPHVVASLGFHVFLRAGRPGAQLRVEQAGRVLLEGSVTAAPPLPPSALRQARSVLAWGVDGGVGAGLPFAQVCERPLDESVLPFVRAGFEVVAIPEGRSDAEAEARRVAARALAHVGPAGPRWQLLDDVPGLPTVSVVIPVRDRGDLTAACLAAVADTLPDDFRGEVVVVDDGSTDDTPAVLETWQAHLPLRVVRHDHGLGFVDACNDGARVATGDVLVFLNNDALVLPGWLPALLDGLALPDAGAVGGRLLFPDGRLQEAGGAVFAEASAWNLGRDEPRPDDPPWEHLRTVDYCSAALLATPRALFLQAGLFDETYRPAYYEDTDYAFTLRRLGRCVYYQPAARAVHLEGGTAGRDPAAGTKVFQVRNRERFARKWAVELASQPPAPASLLPALGRRHARRGGRRVLVVCHDTPRWDAEGGSRRLLHLVRMLMADGWRATVLVHLPSSPRHELELRAMGVEVVPGPGAAEPVDPAALLGEASFDLALLAFWHVADAYLPILRRHAPQMPAMVDSVDLAFLRTARQRVVEGQLSPQDGEDYRRELNAYAGADLVLTVSDEEARVLELLLGARVRARTVQDAEDVARSRVPLAQRQGVVFIGNFRHAPNVDAAEWLCHDVWPRVPAGLRARHPLVLVGGNLEPAHEAALRGAPQVRIAGWVPSVEPYLHGGRLSVVPLRFGAGTKRKLVQSLLAGTPVITTSLGLEGLGLVDGDGLCVADDAASFATLLERLLEDDAEWHRLAEAGRPRVLERHDPALVAARLREVVEELVGSSRPPA